MDLIYLDNNATTQPAPQVTAAMQEMLTELWGNPSSVHRFGQAARQRVELARAAVAKLVGCRDRDLIFTSGGTEANNLALRGLAKLEVLITSTVEHAAVREPAEKLAAAGVKLIKLPINIDGVIDPADVATAVGEHRASAVLVSVQWVNNETGVIQPIEAIAAAVHEAGGGKAMLHVDATQAVGRMAVDVKAAGIDLMTFAAHKFHGPKGVGALYVGRGVRLRSMNQGGPQERDRRGGTENTAGIVGMGVAAELAMAFVADESQQAKLTAMRDRFEAAILRAVPEAQVNGARIPATRRLWSTTNIGFPRLEAEAILVGLSERGVCASAGAACSSGSLDPSPVLLAMGIAAEVAHGSVRFSIGRNTTEAELDRAIAIVPEVVGRLNRAMPVG